jgi:hypothetical protein
VRWNTVSCAACSAISGIDCTPDEPVPITATRWPVKSTPWCGQRPVEYTGPWKRPAPGMSGALGTDRQPLAMMTCWALMLASVLVRMRQRLAAASQCAASTLVLKSMSRRRS